MTERDTSTHRATVNTDVGFEEGDGKSLTRIMMIPKNAKTVVYLEEIWREKTTKEQFDSGPKQMYK